MKVPQQLQYTAEHLWLAAQADGSYLAGITDYAQDLLGDIVYVEAPPVGTHLVAGTPCGLVESVKTGSDLHAPLSGVVEAINEELQSSPELLNEAPYQNWIFRFRATSTETPLLDAAAYAALTAG